LAGRASVGFSHLFDYLAGFASGRIARSAEPVIDFPAPALIRVDARETIAQLGFDLAFEEMVTRASNFGLVAFAQHGSYTTGELGYYVRRLARRGLVALAATNGPALMTTQGNRERVYCTNPLAFAAPVAGGPPIVIDQASSATAFVRIRKAAERGEAIPAGWAIGPDGSPTTDPKEAIKGALVAFGGSRGANIALMVEILAAGVGGAHWSLDSPPFIAGGVSPGAGLFVMALQPGLFAEDFEERMTRQMERLAGKGIHIPGQHDREDGTIELSDEIVARLEAAAVG
jgi:(2R)-3-sulfolactate dehydrogenase (NADP+)